MSTAALGAGCPVPSFITNNFNRGEKVDNKSGRYYWSCKHCSDAVRIQGRDNQLPNHLIHKCKKCPAEIRKQARMFVMDKAGGEDAVEFINSDINVDVAADLEANFAWAPPLAPQTQNIDDDFAGPESISLDEIDAAFALLEHEKEVMERVLDDGNEVLEGQVYDFAELEHVDRGLLPKSVDDEVIVVDHTSHDDGQWDVDMLMSCNGVS
ncbi:hypothetical protein F4604DRAFT_1954190 [Suillus subluteus]|nr:hypothetical protein F4604DRAFT_1954190 [Suillus subluteus]